MTSKVPSAHHLLRKATRRPDFSRSTRQTLVDVALRLFSEQGYANTSLDAIVTGAEVTKGALYHHFKGKQELFEAVFVQVEEQATQRIRAEIAQASDPWDKAVRGLRSFLEVTLTDAYRRIVIQEGPSVLGYERFREQEERHAFGIIHEIVAEVLRGYELSDGTVEAFTRLFFGAMSATGSAVSTASDPDQASRAAEEAVLLVLAGMRSLAETGDRLPTARDLRRPRG